MMLYKGMKRILDKDFRERAGKHLSIDGAEQFKCGACGSKSTRTPGQIQQHTQVSLLIRELFAELPESKIRGYAPGRFSFNVRGGRCEACSGAGSVKVSMLFLPDVYVDCEVCGGTRYNRETLEVRYKGRNIADVLNMTVDDAFEFFKEIPRIASKLALIQEAGLGYIRLGQSALTLSGGSTWVKLAKELSKRFRSYSVSSRRTNNRFILYRCEKLLHSPSHRGSGFCGDHRA